jgi:hypothetical protein
VTPCSFVDTNVSEERDEASVFLRNVGSTGCHIPENSNFQFRVSSLRILSNNFTFRTNLMSVDCILSMSVSISISMSMSCDAVSAMEYWHRMGHIFENNLIFYSCLF